MPGRRALECTAGSFSFVASLVHPGRIAPSSIYISIQGSRRTEDAFGLYRGK